MANSGPRRFEAFEALKTRVRPGITLELVYNRDDDRQTTRGHVESILDDGIIISTTTTTYITASSIIEWSMSQAIQMTIRTRAQFALELPKPIFQATDLPFELQKALVTWKNKYDNALRINELFRIRQFLPEIINLADTSLQPVLFTLAGNLLYRYTQNKDGAAVFINRAAANNHIPALDFLCRLQANKGHLEEAYTTLAHCLLLTFTNKIRPAEDYVDILTRLTDSIERPPLRYLDVLYPILVKNPSASSFLELLTIGLRANNVNLESLTSSTDPMTSTQESVTSQAAYSHSVVNDQQRDLLKTIFHSSHDAHHSGYITSYYKDRGFGFLKESITKEWWWFAFKDVDDHSLQAYLNTSLSSRLEPALEVTFQSSDEPQRGQYPVARHINAARPPTLTTLGATTARNTARPPSSSTYERAKQSDVQGRLQDAEKLYKQEITNRGPRYRSAIKDLVMLLSRQSRPDEALTLLDMYAEHYGYNEQFSLKQVRKSILLKAKRFRDVISLLDGMLTETSTSAQRTQLRMEQGYCYLALSDYETALRITEALLANSTNNEAIIHLIQRIKQTRDEPKESDATTREADDIDIDLADYELVTEHLSVMGLRALEACTYVGVDARSRERGEYSANDLKSLNRSVERLRGQLGRERADLFLSMAAIVRAHPEIETRRSLASYMHSYFFNLAKDALATHKNIDSVRALLAESYFYSSNDRRQLTRVLVVLIRTYISHDSIITNDINSPSALNEAISLLLSEQSALSRFLIHLPHYAYMRKDISSILGENAQFAQLIADTSLPKHIYPPLDFKTLEDAFSGRIALTYSNLLTLKDFLLKSQPSLLFELDIKYLSECCDLIDQTREFYTSTSYIAKTGVFSRQIPRFTEQIEKMKALPTFFSSKYLQACLEYLRNNLKQQYQDLQEKPVQLVLSDPLVNDFYVVQAGYIQLQLELSSPDHSSPAVTNIELLIDNCELQMDPLPDALHGGGRKILLGSLKLSSEQELDQAFTINPYVRYCSTSGTTAQTAPFPIAVRLGTPAQEPISNPYSSYGQGLPIEVDDMLFGRDQIIKRILDAINSPEMGQCFILHGQKRSGKTSVMKAISRRSNFANNADLQVIPVAITMDTIGNTNIESELYEEIFYNVKDHLKDVSWHRELDSTNVSGKPFLKLKALCDLLTNHDMHLILLIDEFTHIYHLSHRETITSFLRFWKALIEARIFNSLLVGQDTMPRFIKDYPNELAVTRIERLSYLDKGDVEQLAVNPILQNGKSRYRGNALQRLYQATAGNPYLTQILLDNLVNYVNSNKAPYITEADVEAVATSRLSGTNRFSQKDFDHLVTAGAQSASQVPTPILWKVMSTIAITANDTGYSDISSLRDIDDYAEAVRDLSDRDCIELDGERLRVKVGIFSDWLRVNYRSL